MDILKRCITVIFLMVFVWGCATSGETTSGTSGTDNSTQIDVNNPVLSLADYLREVPGVTVQGYGSDAMIFIRGAGNSLTGAGNQPLFVVDGQRVGNSYAQAVNAVVVNDIDSIEVIKGARASTRYGMIGSNGVILIRTKTH